MDNGNGKSSLAIPEGLNGNGWDAFMKMVTSFIGYFSSVSTSENICAPLNAISFQVPKRVEARSFHNQDLSIVPYLSALNAPIQEF